MSKLLKWLGRMSLRLSVLSACLTYLYEVRRIAVERVGEQKGMLSMLEVEASLNSEALTPLIHEQHRIVTGYRPLLRTIVWERYYVRMTQIVSDAPLLARVEIYYRQLQSLSEELRTEVSERSEVENLNQKAQRCDEASRSMVEELHKYMIRLQAQEYGKI